MKIAVTGAGGFIGSAVLAHLEQAGHQAVRITRDRLAKPDFSGVEAIIHCAGIAHKTGRNAADPAEMDAVNHHLVLSLAAQARDAGVSRFVFVSSINVVAGQPSPLTVNMPYHPLSAYGEAKALAEQGLLKMQGIECVIARPALTYGAGAPGNLQSLLRLCDSRLLLPFGCADNQRSFVSLNNVVRGLEFLAQAQRSKVAGRIFHLADPLPLATKQLVTLFRQMMNRPRNLMPVPRFVMKAGLVLLGKQVMYEQLFENMIIDGHDLEEAGFRYADNTACLADMQAMILGYLNKKAG